MKKLLIIFALFFLTSCAPLAEDVLLLPDISGILFELYELPYAPDPRLPDMGVREIDWEDDGVLRLSMRFPQTLNPLLNRDPSVARVLGLLFEPLAVLDEQLRPVGNLATLDFSLDFTMVEVSIRPDAIWSDGLPVTSDDLIFSIDVLRSAPADAIYRARVQNIASVMRIDDRTAHIFFHEANPAAAFSLLFPLIPRHYYLHETLPGSQRNMTPLGNGLFEFHDTVPLQSIQLVRNPHTFRTLPVIEQVEILFSPGTQVDLYAFGRGLVDAYRMPLPDWVRNPTAGVVRAQPFPAMYFEFIGFNYSRVIFHDMEVRQGIAQVFNVDEAVETLYLHHAVRAATPVHPYSWFADPTARGFEYDPLRARVLLRDVPRDYTAPWIILVNQDSPERTAMAHRLAAGLDSLGIYSEVHAVSAYYFLYRLHEGSYDLFIGWVELNFVPNFSFLFPHDTTLESLFTATRVAATEAAFTAAHSLFQHAFAERVPVLGLAFRHSAVLTTTRVYSDVMPTPNSILLYVNYWRIG